ncbi:hypothetical protein MKW92_008007, partial [Papaver armeniacum]
MAGAFVSQFRRWMPKWKWIAEVDVTRAENVVEDNMKIVFEQNKERLAFLKWGSTAFCNMLVVPP